MCEEKHVSLTNWTEPCSNCLLQMAFCFSPPLWHFFIDFTPYNFNFTLQQTSCVCTWPCTWSQGCRTNISYQKKNLEKKFASSTGDFCILRAPPVWVPCTWVSPAWLRGDARPLYSPLRVCSECIVAMQSSWCQKTKNCTSSVTLRASLGFLFLHLLKLNVFLRVFLVLFSAASHSPLRLPSFHSLSLFYLPLTLWQGEDSPSFMGSPTTETSFPRRLASG